MNSGWMRARKAVLGTSRTGGGAAWSGRLLRRRPGVDSSAGLRAGAAAGSSGAAAASAWLQARSAVWSFLGFGTRCLVVFQKVLVLSVSLRRRRRNLFGPFGLVVPPMSFQAA